MQGHEGYRPFCTVPRNCLTMSQQDLPKKSPFRRKALRRKEHMAMLMLTADSSTTNSRQKWIQIMPVMHPQLPGQREAAMKDCRAPSYLQKKLQPMALQALRMGQQSLQ